MASLLSSWSVAALFALGFSGTASAMYERCPGCNAAQMNTTAKNRGIGTWVVWNPTNADVRKYIVTCGIVNGTDPTTKQSAGGGATSSAAPPQTDATCTAIEAPLPQSVRDVAAVLLQLSRATGGPYQVAADVYAHTWNIPSVPNPTAHDYAGDSNYRSQLNDILQVDGMLHIGSTPIRGFIEYLKAHADAALSFTDSVATVITVVFDDGSKARVKVKLDDPAEYIKGSARDSTGQALPDDNIPAYGGRWFYGGTEVLNFERFGRLLRQLGAEVIVGTHNSGFLVCSWQSDHNRLSCHWSQY
jgi:hypothetical protein